MNVEEIRKKVRSLCEDAGLQFFFAVPNASEWAVTDCEHLRKIVSYHKELETLPPVTPTHKKGKWIDTTEISTNKRGQIVHEVICSECNGISYFRAMGDKYIGANFCPNCGSRNEV